MDETIEGRREITRLVPDTQEGCPLYPSQTDLLEQEGVVTHELAVDSVTQLQKGVKEKVAWLEQAGRPLQHLIVVEDLDKQITPAAKDQYGLDKALILWLLEECIPCFVIH